MLVKKGNKVYTIQDIDKEHYLKQGYAVVDGKNLKVLESRDLSLEAQLKALKKENKELKAKIKEQK